MVKREPTHKELVGHTRTLWQMVIELKKRVALLEKQGPAWAKPNVVTKPANPGLFDEYLTYNKYQKTPKKSP